MRSILVALCLLVTHAAIGADDSWRPPERYRAGEPIAPIRVYSDLSYGEVQALCADSVADPRYANEPIIACTRFTRGSEFLSWDDRQRATECNIFVIGSSDTERTARIVEHEEGHCRGWPPDHPSL